MNQNCKLVKAIPDRIVVYKNNTTSIILFSYLRGVPKQNAIDVSTFNKYLIEYYCEVNYCNIKYVFSNFVKKNKYG